MRRQRLSWDRARGAPLEQLPESLPRHRPPAPGHEDEVARALLQQRGTRFLRVARKPRERLLPERDQALLRALAEDAHHAHVEAHFGELQARQLRDAQPARVEHFQHRPVAKPERRVGVRLREQRLDVGLGERPGKARRLLRRIELERRVDLDAPAAHEEPVETLEAGVQPRLRARSNALLRAPQVTPGEIAGKIGLGRGEERGAALLLQPFGKEAQVAAVGLQRVFREAVLEPDRVAEFIEQRGVLRVHSARKAPSCASSQRFTERWNPPAR